MPINVPSSPRLTQVQTREASMPNVRANTNVPAAAFGGGQGAEALSRATDGILNQAVGIADREKQKADQIVTTDFNTKLTQLKNKLIYDPKEGLMTRKGKDAFGAPEEYSTRFDKEVEELQKGLNNQTQRDVASRMISQHRAELDGDIQRHISTESRRYDDQTTDSGLAVALDDATLNYKDPEKVSKAIDTQRAIVIDYANRQGLPPEAVKEKLDQVTSQTHAAVVGRMLSNGEDLSAKRYFEENRQAITGKDAASMEKALEEGTLRGESQRQTDAIMKKGLSMSAAIEQAKKVEDPKLRDAITDRVRQEYSLQDAARRDAIEKMHIQATNIIDKTGSIDEIPPQTWSQFTLSERSALKSYARQRQEGIQPVTNWDDYYEVKTLAAYPSTQDKFLKMNLMEYRPKMADAEFKELVSLQTSLRKGDEKAIEKLDGFRSDMDIINGVLSDAGIKHGDKASKEDNRRANLFKSKVDQEVMKLQQVTNKKATNEDIKRIADSLMIEGITEKREWWFDTKKRAFELDPETDKKFIIDAKAVPAAERERIEAALKRRGFKVSDEAILKLYKTRLGGMVKSGGQ